MRFSIAIVLIGWVLAALLCGANGIVYLIHWVVS